MKISELAERAEVPVATVRHYLREGLLPEPVKTSRNMAYYPPEFAERIRLIKQLQEERFMPLRVIRDLLEREEAAPERLRAMIELEDRILDRALAGERERVPAEEVQSRYELPREVLDRLADVGVLTPDEGGYSPSDVRIIEAIGRFRAGGYDESIGFTVYDTLRYKQALEGVVAQEVDVLTQRLSGEVDPDRAIEIIEAGVEPLNELISALHTKLLVARLEGQRAGGGFSAGALAGTGSAMDGERDQRASEPPEDGEGGAESSDGEQDAGEAPGPRGNPATDEEALRQQQQEPGETS
jgi:DNA-binding transcriptional MerR regulator